MCSYTTDVFKNVSCLLAEALAVESLTSLPRTILSSPPKGILQVAPPPRSALLCSLLMIKETLGRIGKACWYIKPDLRAGCN